MKSGYIKLISLIGNSGRKIETKYYCSEEHRNEIIKEWLMDYSMNFAKGLYCIQIVPDIKNLINGKEYSSYK